MSSFTPIIGMEVHVELATDSKMFCRCSASHFHIPPNTHTCPVCLGLPGALPVPNKQAIDDTIAIGLALNCQINNQSKFDRKHYFYPDLPKGYQISQYEQPFCFNGSITLSTGKKIRITRVHLEEDTGKLKHQTVNNQDTSLIDFNRSGVPLVEIVTEPDLSSAEEVKEYLKLIHSTVRYLGVSDADMEKGSMRLEANISVSSNGLLPDYKVEVKNVNSFRYIAAAIDYEINRQTKLLQDKHIPPQETRGWDLNKKVTVSQRSKEEAKDYRYFPEPDIPPFSISNDDINQIKSSLPQLPRDIISSLMIDGIRRNYALTISENQDLAKYALTLVTEAINAHQDPDKIVGLVINDKYDWKKLSPVELLHEYSKTAREQKTTPEQTEILVKQVLQDNPQVVTDYQNGKLNALQFLLGQVMKLSLGKADPAATKQILETQLSSSH